MLGRHGSTDYRPLVFGLILGMTPSLSCQTNDSANSLTVNRSVPPINPSAISSDYQTQPIRKVDFANFTYDWYPKGLHSANKSSSVTLQNDKFEFEPKEGETRSPLLLTLENISYYDFNGRCQR